MLGIYTVHLPEQAADELVTRLRVTGISDLNLVIKWLKSLENPRMFCGYSASETGADLLVDMYSRLPSTWNVYGYWRAFTIREMLFGIDRPQTNKPSELRRDEFNKPSIVPRGEFRFPTQVGEEPTLCWSADVTEHVAPQQLSIARIGCAFGDR